jgi:hypothetical protein
MKYVALIIASLLLAGCFLTTQPPQPPGDDLWLIVKNRNV